MREIIKKINFKKLKGLVPVIIQDYKTGSVLMLGFMNKEALKKSLKEGKVTYWSRSRKKFWTKGETSGNFQFIKEIWLDCDNDTLLIKVKQIGNVCHTGNKTCFFKKIWQKKIK
jgi:phosphoribosyl-AMP cyclohydrolase